MCCDAHEALIKKSKMQNSKSHQSGNNLKIFAVYFEFDDVEEINGREQSC
jgi:hypothetical protein